MPLVRLNKQAFSLDHDNNTFHLYHDNAELEQHLEGPKLEHLYKLPRKYRTNRERPTLICD